MATTNIEILRTIIPYLASQGLDLEKGDEKTTGKFCPKCKAHFKHTFNKENYSLTCSGCGQSWNIIDLMISDKNDTITEKGAIEYICTHYNIDVGEAPSAEMANRIAEYEKSPNRFKRLEGLGFDRQTIINLNLLYDDFRPHYNAKTKEKDGSYPSLVIPSKAALIYRIIGDLPDKQVDKLSFSGHRNLYRVEALKGKGRLFVTKNEDDAVAIIALGHNAMALGKATVQNLKDELEKIDPANRRLLISVSGACDNLAACVCSWDGSVFDAFDKPNENPDRKSLILFLNELDPPEERKPEEEKKDETEPDFLNNTSLVPTTKILHSFFSDNRPIPISTDIKSLDEKLHGGLMEHIVSISGNNNQAMDFAVQTVFKNFNAIPVIFCSEHYQAYEIASRIYRRQVFYSRYTIKSVYNKDITDILHLDVNDQRFIADIFENLPKTMEMMYFCPSPEMLDKIYLAVKEKYKVFPFVIAEGIVAQQYRKYEVYKDVKNTALLITREPIEDANCTIKIHAKVAQEVDVPVKCELEVFRKFYGTSFMLDDVVYQEEYASFV